MFDVPQRMVTMLLHAIQQRWRGVEWTLIQANCEATARTKGEADLAASVARENLALHAGTREEGCSRHANLQIS